MSADLTLKVTSGLPTFHREGLGPSGRKSEYDVKMRFQLDVRLSVCGAGWSIPT